MMQKQYLIIFLLFLNGLLNAQNLRIDIDKYKEVNPWDNTEANIGPDQFQFAIVSDRAGGQRDGVFEDAVKKLNLLQPEFVMSIGDYIEGYSKDEKVLNNEWAELNAIINKLQMPFFYLPGNHDYSNEVMAKVWKEHFGSSYYHFTYKNVLFLCLNTEEAIKGSGKGGIEKPQFQYAKKVLEENQNVKWTFIFMHQPLWNMENTRYWPELELMLKDRNHNVFAGHYHKYKMYKRNNGKYMIMATTGGVSSLRGTEYGEFDHLVWVTMKNDGPVIANLLLEGILEENIVTEEKTE